MKVTQLLFRSFAWGVTVLLQLIGALVVIFLLSLMVTAEPVNLGGWLLLILAIWLGGCTGIFGVGWLALRFYWKQSPRRWRVRLLTTLACYMVPLLVLLGIGLSVPFGGMDSQFYDTISNNWQPTLSQIGLALGVLGFHLPSWFRGKLKST